MGKEKKKGESGIATTYLSRSQALRKLQISMTEFRRLCILKGIYPQDPRQRNKASHGSAYKTLYYRKDIQYLAHDPLLEKTREFKIFVKKLKKALNKEDQLKADKLDENRPVYSLDHIVKERYPTFIDALRDLDDALSLVFLFATFPQTAIIKASVSNSCRRLSIEFLHYVIDCRALRKVFLSIKGVYYQAEIEGQTITWVTPHRFSPQLPRDVDYRIMSTFVEFYTTLLGFINFRLYSSLNLKYPPQIAGLSSLPGVTSISSQVTEVKELSKEEHSHLELLESLSQSLARVLSPDDAVMDEEEDEEEIPVDLDPDEQSERDKAKMEQEKLEKLKGLFEGCRFFISRETPRESLTFVIRSLGGEVSWDSHDAAGSTYHETDDSITHQIVDRPSQTHRYLSRIYIQPQWVYDSVNFRRLLPVTNYSAGASLPPHLSPFVEGGEGEYIPPDMQAMMGSESEEAVREQDLDEEDEIVDDKDERPIPAAKRLRIEKVLPVGSVVAGDGEDEEVVAEEEEGEESNTLSREEKKLAIMMMSKKRKWLYNRIMTKRHRRTQKVKELQRRRTEYDGKQRSRT